MYVRHPKIFTILYTLYKDISFYVHFGFFYLVVNFFQNKLLFLLAWWFKPDCVQFLNLLLERSSVEFREFPPYFHPSLKLRLSFCNIFACTFRNLKASIALLFSTFLYFMFDYKFIVFFVLLSSKVMYSNSYFI